METTVIEKQKLIQAELSCDVVEFLTKDGLICVLLNEVLDWIEIERLNETTEVICNTSILGDDPSYDVEGPVFIDPFDYLDNNWEEVTGIYFETILNK